MISISVFYGIVSSNYTELDTESGGSSPFPPLDTESGGSSPFPPLNTESGWTSPFSPVGYIEGMWVECILPICDSVLRDNRVHRQPCQSKLSNGFDSWPKSKLSNGFDSWPLRSLNSATDSILGHGSLNSATASILGNRVRYVV
ncbi:unnamed protein product [Rodentolepis nana]|uniref:Ovule protein n=1 Tax=Rodentolepis nana TaxID=102285 RepID=A0A0R3U0G7_RODNA|nr:unnamed protein product [Rodentolepis nana]